MIRGSGSNNYHARLTQAPPGTPVSNALETGVGLKRENVQGMSKVDTSSIFSATKKEVARAAARVRGRPERRVSRKERSPETLS